MKQSKFDLKIIYSNTFSVINKEGSSTVPCHELALLPLLMQSDDVLLK